MSISIKQPTIKLHYESLTPLFLFCHSTGLEIAVAPVRADRFNLNWPTSLIYPIMRACVSTA
jgi:hypothetical protein